jgi:hypothetical protein
MRRRGRIHRALTIVLAVTAVYLSTAYVALPMLWSHYEHQPGLAEKPMVTRTSFGIPGDPINIGLVGSEADVVEAFARANWHPADPVTLKTSIGIAGSVILNRPYPTAPVSPLYYDGRKQDLAFESPVGNSANRRHHVRLWKVLASGVEGRAVWLGSATFDTGSGCSRYTGQITHHIAADIDEERDQVMTDLIAAHMVIQRYSVSGIGPTINGRNGGGDRYYTDGEVDIAVLSPDGVPTNGPPEVLESPLPTTLKDYVFSKVEDILDGDNEDDVPSAERLDPP